MKKSYSGSVPEFSASTLSDDLEDISALIPGHLLIGALLLAISEPIDIADEKGRKFSVAMATSTKDA